MSKGSERQASFTDVAKLTAELNNVTLAVRKVKVDDDALVNVDGEPDKKMNVDDSSKDPEKNVEWDQLSVVLDALQCPFNWIPAQDFPNDRVQNPPEKIISNVLEKQEEIEEDDDFQWRKLVLNLVLCYEYHHVGDASQSRAKQRECEAVLASFSQDRLLMKTSEAALFHVVMACKAHLLHASGIIGETRLLLKSLQPYGEMSDENLACVAGVRGSILMEYGYDGTKAAVTWIEQAIDLDPEQGEWHFLLGKTLGRTRRVEKYNSVPEKRELKALERAVELTKSPAYMTFLAQAYRETAFRVFSLNRNNIGPLKDSLNQMNQRSLDLYKKTLKLRPNCAHTNVRCAQGFLKLPYPYKDERLSKECADHAMVLAPNNAMVMHTIGTVHCRLDNKKLALKYYKDAGQQGSYGAWMDYMRLRYSMDKNYNPMPDLEVVRESFLDEPRMNETLCQIGGYHLFIENDLVSALEPWLKVVRQFPDNQKLKNFKSIFLPMLKPISLLDVILDECRLTLEAGGLQVTGMETLREAVEVCLQLNPDAGSPKPRRQMALDDIPPVKERGGFRGNRGSRRGRGNRGSNRGMVRGDYSGDLKQNRNREKRYSDSSNEGRSSFGDRNRGNWRSNKGHSLGSGYRRDGGSDSESGIRNNSRDRNPSRGSYRCNSGDRNASHFGSGNNQSRERSFGSGYRRDGGPSNENAGNSKDRREQSHGSGYRRNSGSDNETSKPQSRSRDSSVDSAGHPRVRPGFYDERMKGRSDGDKNWRRRDSSASSVESNHGPSRGSSDWRKGCVGRQQN